MIDRLLGDPRLGAAQLACVALLLLLLLISFPVKAGEADRINVRPDGELDFGKSNFQNLPLPIQKDIRFNTRDGSTIRVTSFEIASGDVDHFTLVTPFMPFDIIAGMTPEVDIRFNTSIMENRVYRAVVEIRTNLPPPEEFIDVDLRAEVILASPGDVGSVVINEFSYDPRDPNGFTGDFNRDGDPDNDEDEFVELFNVTNNPIDISGWSIDDDNVENENTFLFPPGTIIDAGGFVVVFGGGMPMAFDIPFFERLPRLGNGGDQIRLADGSKEIDSVGFEDGATMGTPTMNNLTIESNGGVIARGLDGNTVFISRPAAGATVGRSNDLSAPRPPLGDVDQNLEVDAKDILLFIKAWRLERAFQRVGFGDIDSNGFRTPTDLFFFQSGWQVDVREGSR